MDSHALKCRIAESVRETRIHRGIFRWESAAKANCSEDILAQIESPGFDPFPPWSVLTKVLWSLGISVNRYGASIPEIMDLCEVEPPVVLTDGQKKLQQQYTISTVRPYPH